MTMRRRFLTAASIAKLGLLKSIHFYNGILSRPARVRSQLLGALFYRHVSALVRAETGLDSNIPFILHKTQLGSVCMRLIDSDRYEYARKEILGFCQNVADVLIRSDNIYAHSGEALELFRKTSGRRILDQTALLPLDELALFENSTGREAPADWRRYMQFLQERNVEEISLADRVLCLYQQTRESVTKWCPSARVVVINHPCSYPRGKKFHDSGSLRFLFVGRKSRGKGVDLIEQWLLRSPYARRIKFTLCGPDGDYSLKALSGRPNVDLRGRQSRTQLDDLYRQADLCVFPEQQNALGNVAFEAMEWGTPVLARQNELLIDDVNGFVFTDEQDFFRRMDALASLAHGELYAIGRAAMSIPRLRSEKYCEELSVALSVP